MTTTGVKEQVELDLATEMGDHSVARISTISREHVADAYISNGVRMNVCADPEEGVWIAISGHTYAQIGQGKPLTTSVDYISHHFTEAEARALLEILTNELRKLD